MFPPNFAPDVPPLKAVRGNARSSAEVRLHNILHNTGRVVVSSNYSAEALKHTLCEWCWMMLNVSPCVLIQHWGVGKAQPSGLSPNKPALESGHSFFMLWWSFLQLFCVIWLELLAPIHKHCVSLGCIVRFKISESGPVYVVRDLLRSCISMHCTKHT